MPFGFNGKILRVDLSRSHTWVEEPGDAFFRRYLGGRAMAAHYLLTMLRPGVDPLGPDNVLVFAPGVITASPFSGQGRNGVAAKSPLTGGFGSSEVGGFWGAELKRAGFDAIVVEGRASHPVYLWVHDGEAELRDASHVWGMEVAETQDRLRQDLENKGARTALIGPAGENQVRFANVVNDLSHFAGRTGMGAVMGSKLLKGIVTRGKGNLPVANPAGVKELATWMTSHLDLTAHFHDVGTAGGLRALHLAGGLPTFNFQEGAFSGNEKISGQTMRDSILVKRDTCFACAVRCKRVVEVNEGPIRVDPKYGGPEYETLAAFGSNAGIDNLVALAKASERSAALGMDSISCGMVISYAMELYEKGILTPEDTGGVELRFGDAAVMLDMIEKVAHREGIGDLLAEGVKRISEHVGRGAEEYAMHVKGQELPMHEPRIKHALGMGYTISPTGADHMHNMHDVAYMAEGPALDRIREYDPAFKPVAPHGFDAQKMRMFYYHSTFRHFMDSVGLCHFLPYSPQQMANVINAITGWDMDLWEVHRIGERGATMARAFNVREGFTAADDALPKRFFKEFRDNNSATGKPLDLEAMEEAKRGYYRHMGWDDEGIPTGERLRELDIEWVAEAGAAY